MQEPLNALGKELWSDLARKFMTDSACTLESILQVTLVEFRKNPWTNSTTFFGRILHEFLNLFCIYEQIKMNFWTDSAGIYERIL